MRTTVNKLLLGTLLMLLLVSPLQVHASKKLIPMGQSIGVALKLNFIYVSHDVLLENGSWLKSGMIIEEIDHRRIKTVKDVEELLANNPKRELILRASLNGKASELSLQLKEVQYLIPFLKNETDGIGTLTYIDPESLQYGALGHQIIDEKLKGPPPFTEGAIFLAYIHQIKKSTPGKPGYKMSVLAKDAVKLGNVELNELYGIFGKWETASQNSLPKPIEIMQREEIKKGKATLYTAIKGSEVEKFSINITEISQEALKFEITDKQLLEKTGGILQGMSGSPIIQNGQFVGAVTHMYVDEPQKGAAIPLEEMLKKTP